MDENWSQFEKRQLLTGLREFGIENVEMVATYVSTKSINQVRKAIQYYTQQAEMEMQKQPEDILDAWKEILNKYSKNLPGATVSVARAYRLMALRAPGTENDGVDLKGCYNFVADIMEGKEPKPLNTATMTFLSKCFEKLPTMYPQHIERCKKQFCDLPVSNVLQKTGEWKIENGCCNPSRSKVCVFCDPSFNPLKIPMHLLKVPADNTM